MRAVAHLFDLDGCVLNNEFVDQYQEVLENTLADYKKKSLTILSERLTPAEYNSSHEPTTPELSHKIKTIMAELHTQCYQKFRSAVQKITEETNQPLMKFMAATFKDGQVILGSVSNRLNYTIDKRNQLKDDLVYPSVTECLLDLEAVLQKTLGDRVQVNPLLSDFFCKTDSQVGTMFNEIQAINKKSFSDLLNYKGTALSPFKKLTRLQPGNPRVFPALLQKNPDYKDFSALSFPFSNVSKVAIYFQMIQLTTLRMQVESDLYIYDDRTDLLENAIEVFTKNPTLLTAGAVVHFMHYEGEGEAPRELVSIIGTGVQLSEDQIKDCMRDYRDNKQEAEETGAEFVDSVYRRMPALKTAVRSDNGVRSQSVSTRASPVDASVVAGIASMDWGTLINLEVRALPPSLVIDRPKAVEAKYNINFFVRTVCKLAKF